MVRINSVREHMFTAQEVLVYSLCFDTRFHEHNGSGENVHTNCNN